MAIEIFSSTDVKTCVVDGNTWFRAKDVAAALDYVDPKHAIRVHVSPLNKQQLGQLHSNQPR